MTKLTASLTFLAILLATVPEQAQLARTFVSSSGSDLNNCDRLTPCRTFQHAHDQTLAQGEIPVLDPGGYGSVTINRAISMINDGVGEAGVLVSGGATLIAKKLTIQRPSIPQGTAHKLRLSQVGEQWRNRRQLGPCRTPWFPTTAFMGF